MRCIVCIGNTTSLDSLETSKFAMFTGQQILCYIFGPQHSPRVNMTVCCRCNSSRRCVSCVCVRKGTPCVNCLPLRRERCQNTGTPDRDNTNTTIVSPDTNPNNHDSSHTNHDSESANILGNSGNDEAAEDESQSEL